MNRETKRLLQRQGQIEADGSPSTRRATQAPAKRQPRQRTSARDFLRQVRDEMRQVAWPTRHELINYTVVVLTTLVFMVSLIFLLNLAFGKLIFELFQK
jgi:preprotein translocase subunit SecE